MKTIKKALAILLSVLMVMSITVVAVAAAAEPSTHKICIKNSTPGYTYTAYQIFDGKAGGTGNKILSDIEWGADVDGDALLAALDNDDTLKAKFTGVTTAQQVAEKLAGISNADEIIAFAELVEKNLKTGTTGRASTNTLADVHHGVNSSHYELSVPDGYYLVKNTAIPPNPNADADKTNNAYTSMILEVVGKDEMVEHKAEAPKLEKEIQKDNGDWSNVDDSQIGDKVNFKITTTVPDTTGYDTYKYVIHDSLSEGLTFNNDIKLYYTDDEGKLVEITQKVGDTEYYSVRTNGHFLDGDRTHDGDECDFIVVVYILNLIKDGVVKQGDKIYTQYSATLNDNAVVYDGKNNNTAKLEYSNNPRDEKDKTFTPDSKVYEWTFKVDVTKVDQDKKPLSGAVFVLSKDGTLQNNLGNIDTNGVPTNTANLIQFVKNDDIYTVYDKETVTTPVDAGKLTYVITTPADGKVTIKGLDAGLGADGKTAIYYLYETKAPDGYNSLTAPAEITIKAATYGTDGSTVTAPTIEIKLNGETTEGEANGVKVENKKGSTLPETGGIGTTIFYVVGGAMMFVAVVLLVTKKKMSKNNK